jgi:hypothetical protein
VRGKAASIGERGVAENERPLFLPAGFFCYPSESIEPPDVGGVGTYVGSQEKVEDKKSLVSRNSLGSVGYRITLDSRDEPSRTTNPRLCSDLLGC